MDAAREMTREEAKRVLEFDLDHTYNDESKEALRMAIKALEQEPKIGHWIDIDSESFEFYRVYKCSECGNTEIEYPERICSHFKYCPDCGAKMESEE